MVRSEIDERVCAAVAEAVAMPADRVKPEHYLTNDLGAESLDYLDIVFKLEQEFDIQITRGEMERAARGDMSDDEFAPDGVISDAGLARLRELMPESAEMITDGLRPVEILGLFKVSTFSNIVEAKLEGKTA